MMGPNVYLGARCAGWWLWVTGQLWVGTGELVLGLMLTAD